MASRPIVVCENDDFEVSEISEGGAKIVLHRRVILRNEEPFTGVIFFLSGDRAMLEGIVIRAEDGEMTVRLNEGISMKHMVDEQRFLQKRYLGSFTSLESDEEFEDPDESSGDSEGPSGDA